MCSFALLDRISRNEYDLYTHTHKCTLGIPISLLTRQLQFIDDYHNKTITVLGQCGDLAFRSGRTHDGDSSNNEFCCDFIYKYAQMISSALNVTANVTHADEPEIDLYRMMSAKHLICGTTTYCRLGALLSPHHSVSMDIFNSDFKNITYARQYILELSPLYTVKLS